MKLSVIVPVYNMASDHRLHWCLESLVQQRTSEGDPLGDYEIIAVDDCSTDDSWGILRDYAARWPGKVLALRGDRNRHQGGAKNLALAHARGEWIAFIDADDWVVPDYCAVLLSKAQETGADCVGTDYCIVHEHTMTPGPVAANSRPEQAGVIDDARRRSLLVDFGSLCVKIYRREIVLGDADPRAAESALTGERAAEAGGLSAGFPAQAEGSGTGMPGGEAAGSASPAPAPNRCAVFPEDIFYEDNAVVKTWVMRIRHYEYVPGPLYYYYQHDDSTVHTVSLRRLQDRMVSGRLMLEEAERRGYLTDYKPEIEYSFTVLFYKNTLFGALQSLTGEEVRRAAAGQQTKDAVKSQESRADSVDAQGVLRMPAYRSVYDFVSRLGAGMKQTFPDFQENPYYQARTDAEEKKLIAMQMRSPRRFYLYYRLLWFYRRIRYGRK